MSQSQKGIVKWFSRLKGYGFIEPEDGGGEVFVHYTAIEGDGYRNLYEGDRVAYTVVDEGKGPQAQSVKMLEHESYSTPAPRKATPTPPPPVAKPQISQPKPKPKPAPPPKKSSWLDWLKIFKK